MTDRTKITATLSFENSELLLEDLRDFTEVTDGFGYDAELLVTSEYIEISQPGPEKTEQEKEYTQGGVIKTAHFDELKERIDEENRRRSKFFGSF